MNMKHDPCSSITMLACLLALACLLVLSRPVTAATTNEVVATAAGLAASGDHGEAVKVYEQAIAAGLANGHVFYNLGISSFRQGHLGDAIGAFLAARRLLPRNPDVDSNLRFALARIGDRLEAERPASIGRAAFFFLDYVTPRELLLGVFMLATLAGLLLAAGCLRERWWRCRAFAWGLGGAAVVLLGAFLAKLERDAPWGAVKADAALVRSGPSPTDTVLFKLQTGAPVIVEASSDDASFRRIALSDGKRGWIAVSDLSFFDLKEL